MAPAAATRDIFVDKDGNLIKGEGSSTIGYRASGVPGTPAGFDLAFKKYGSGKIKLARSGRTGPPAGSKWLCSKQPAGRSFQRLTRKSSRNTRTAIGSF